ncbi:MAG: TonB-dependent receptor [Variibacter sp.]
MSTTALGAWIAPGAASAQDALPAIVVTAPSPIVRHPPRRPAQPARAAQPATTPAPSDTPPPVAPTLADVPVGALPIVTDQFATVTVVPESEIRRTPGNTLGDLLFSKPGITGSTFAPGGASRPIVRGLDNYRVRTQENGLATNDVSDLSEDHAVPIDPLAARQIEVIRGPATLRYGSQAIGGVVNVDNNRIPTFIPPRGFAGEVRAAGTTTDSGIEGGVLLDAGAGNFAVHADAFGRRADDYGIPGYPYLNPPSPAPAVNGRQPNSFARTNGGSIGGSYIFDQGFFGLAVSQFNALYGIPGIEATETRTNIDMRQTRVTGKGEYRPLDTPVEAIRYWLALTDYKHDEIADEGGFYGVQQSFINRAQEGRVEVQFRPYVLPFAQVTTAVGVQAGHQALSAPGLEGGLFDPNDSKSVAAYIFNEFRFSPTLRAQIAGRIEHATVDGTSPDFPANFLPPPDDPASQVRNLSFTPKSASFGVLKDLPYGLVASLTAQYVERAPRAGELLSRGVHEATETFEIGNPNLRTEVAKTIEIGLRHAAGPFRFEATAYATHFDNFIYKRLTGVTCDDDFASCGAGGGAFNQIVYSQRAADFIGGELQAQVDLANVAGGVFGVEGQYNIVRATFTDGTNVPRIPPQRVGGGMFWRDGNWFTRVGLLHAFAQNAIADNETPTPSYNLLKAEVSYTHRFAPAPGGPREMTLGVVGTNLLDEEVRNAVSFKKDEVLLPGRSVRFFTTVKW